MKRTLTALCLFSFTACIAPEDADPPAEEPAEEQTSTDTSESIAISGKRTRGSNSQEKLPGDRYLSDFNADGVTDLVRFAAAQVYVNRTDFGETPILSWGTGRPVRRLITGDFHGDG